MTDRLLSVPRFADLLRTLTGVRGGSAAPAVSSVVTPVIVVEAERPESEYHRAIRGRSLMQATASVGQFNHVILLNPAGSSSLVVVTRLVPTPFNLANLLWGVRSKQNTPQPPVGFVGGGGMQVLDLRAKASGFAPTCLPLVFLRQDGTANYFDPYGATGEFGGTSASGAEDVNVVLGPGDALEVVTSVVNVQSGFYAESYTRPLEQGEKAYGT